MLILMVQPNRNAWQWPFFFALFTQFSSQFTLHVKGGHKVFKHVLFTQFSTHLTLNLKGGHKVFKHILHYFSFGAAKRTEDVTLTT